MRKTATGIVTVLAAGLLFLCTALPAAAFTVDFHGKACTGVMSASDAYLLGGKDTNDSTTIGVGKFRFRAEVGTDDGRAKMVYGFETGANNFGDSDSWKYSGDSVDFENRFAYIQLNVPGMNDQVMGRAGLQKTGVNHWVWTETAAGVTLHGKGGVNWSAGWFRGLEEGFGEDDAAETDFYMIKGDFKPGENITIGGFALYGDDFERKNTLTDEDGDPRQPALREGSEQYWMGLTGNIDGPIFASGDLIYQGGDIGEIDDIGRDADLDVSAWLANLIVGARVSDNAKVSVQGLYVSGDDDDTDGDMDAFQSVDADVKVGQIFFKDSLAASLDRFVDDQFGYTMPAPLRNKGLMTFAVDGEIQLDAKNSLRGAVRYLETAEKSLAGEDELGYEFDLWYAYKYNDNLTLKLEGAYLISGDLAEEMFDDDDVYQVAAGMVFAF
ncbi:hypothetical protein HNR65_001312 [Desulfosalsimonas propionicica]|uniref:Porin n=1 Tax=Desulfosalsimonas propionicica TaxID=332175 RepID=A0A7W0HKE5_9BACT|nr:hypothetical protein [Desulfosalsimonas propionicica]MBA2880986.1 hypothetical protein [Desulfosalsimonas propionicica]